jgi:hypothetical protein
MLITIVKYKLFCVYNLTKNRFKPVMDWFGPKPVKTGFVTGENRKRPVNIGSVRFFVGFRNLRTGYGYGLAKFGQKTGPDRTFEH